MAARILILALFVILAYVLPVAALYRHLASAFALAIGSN